MVLVRTVKSVRRCILLKGKELEKVEKVVRVAKAKEARTFVKP